MRHLMSPLDLSVPELDRLLDLAGDIEKNPEKYAHKCDGKILAPLYCLPSGCLPMLGWRRRACGAQLAWPEPVLPLWGSSSLGSPSGCSRTNIQFFWVAVHGTLHSGSSGIFWRGGSR